jgi:hypothetical protein
MEENTNCSICLDTICENQDSYSLSCTHLFHTKCIMDWFRSRSSSGNCPLCNDDPQNLNRNLFYGSRSYYDERFKQIKKYAKKSDSPGELKTEIDKIKILERETQNLKKCKNNYYYSDEIKIIRNNLKKNETEYWTSLRKENKQKMKIIAKYPMLMV